jgi:F0F1-type ATP synthase assembly protein I
MSHEDENESRAQATANMGRYAGLGLQFGAVIVAFTLGGYWLDQKLGTLPLFLLVGLGLAAVGGTISIVRRVPPVRGGRKKKAPARDDTTRGS